VKTFGDGWGRIRNSLELHSVAGRGVNFNAIINRKINTDL